MKILASHKNYAESDGLWFDNIRIQLARSNDQYIFMCGRSTENGNMKISVFDKPKQITTNSALLEHITSFTIDDLQTKAIGQITLGSDCDYNCVIDRIQNELEEGFSLGYAMRISSIAQFPEFQDLQKAHEIAINIKETDRVLRSKHPDNKVTFTPPPAQNTHEIDLSF